MEMVRCMLVTWRVERGQRGDFVNVEVANGGFGAISLAMFMAVRRLMCGER